MDGSGLTAFGAGKVGACADGDGEGDGEDGGENAVNTDGADADADETDVAVGPDGGLGEELGAGVTAAAGGIDDNGIAGLFILLILPVLLSLINPDARSQEKKNVRKESSHLL